MKTHPSVLFPCSIGAVMLSIVASNALGNSASPTKVKSASSAESPASADAEALFKMGRVFAEKGGSDYPKAVDYLRRSAEMGHPGAQNMLGYMYSAGNGVPCDLAKAAEWMEKAAKQGFNKAQYNFALCYFQGSGVTKSIEEGISWMTKAAIAGYVDAQEFLGDAYSTGLFGINKDNEKAFLWTSKVAEKGYASALNALGVMYEYGLGCKRNEKEAMRLYSIAAEQGDAKAQTNLGMMVASDPGRKAIAYKWLTLGAKQKEPTAINYLPGFVPELKPEEVKEGERLAEEFQAKPNPKKSPDSSR